MICHHSDVDEKLTKAQMKAARKIERQKYEIELDKQLKTQRWMRVLLWGGGVLVLIGGLIALFTLTAQPQTSPVASADKLTPVSENDIILGNPDAQVTLIEYADFQCPACALYSKNTAQLLKDFDGKLRVVYRNFPLRAIHRNALPAARAAYSAHKQGAFAAMKMLLFDRQASWALEADPSPLFTSYAKELGLDTTAFEKAYNDPQTLAFVESQENNAITAGIRATPTFFLNGRQITNPAGYDAFKSLIEQELQKSTPTN
jgi:protein-disulfide isomerase